MLAIADERGADDDQNDTNPAYRGNVLAQENDRSESGKDKAKCREWPEKANVTFGHQNDEAKEKEGFEENTQDDLGTKGAGFGDAENFRRIDALHLADVEHAFFQEDDAGRFKNEAHD